MERNITVCPKKTHLELETEYAHEYSQKPTFGSVTSAAEINAYFISLVEPVDLNIFLDRSFITSDNTHLFASDHGEKIQN